jgi:hypothetical protein
MSQSNRYKIEYYLFKHFSKTIIPEKYGWIINIKKLNVCLQYHPDARGYRVKKYRKGFFKTITVNNFILEPTLIEMLKNNNESDYGLAFELLDIRLKEIINK